MPDERQCEAVAEGLRWLLLGLRMIAYRAVTGMMVGIGGDPKRKPPRRTSG